MRINKEQSPDKAALNYMNNRRLIPSLSSNLKSKSTFHNRTRSHSKESKEDDKSRLVNDHQSFD